MIDFLFVILGIIIGCCLMALYLKPKVNAVQKLDKETEEKNLALKNDQIRLGQEVSELIEQNSALAAKKEEIINNISDLKKQSKETSNALYEQAQSLLGERMDNAARVMSEKYQQAEEEAKNDYLKVLNECSIDLISQISEKEKQLSIVTNQMEELSNKVAAAVSAYQRQQEMAEKQDFYRLKLSEIDIKEIAKLREVSDYLRDKEPLNKVIWKVYYEKPYTDLVGRVVGSGVHTGIYKITNIENHMCYVGQAVNIGR